MSPLLALIGPLYMWSALATAIVIGPSILEGYPEPPEDVEGASSYSSSRESSTSD